MQVCRRYVVNPHSHYSTSYTVALFQQLYSWYTVILPLKVSLQAAYVLRLQDSEDSTPRADNSIAEMVCISHLRLPRGKPNHHIPYQSIMLLSDSLITMIRTVFRVRYFAEQPLCEGLDITDIHAPDGQITCA
jgi:hypothetical protein